ncbi:MAG TPA: SEC-C metal-binding domain-containing protein, partial [Verrucomicrobiae bacterium]|nr:SEC-C metal-binding domain-containing protein [Verrucomicrobiae bacterium]
LDVTVIPTNRSLLRHNHPDVVYKTEREKFDAVANEIVECHGQGQPVLVGTVSIEKSERLSKLLKRRGIPHEVLNAKYHEREAEIVAQAGRAGSVTIATNMAGRGTDILLGGNPEMMARKKAAAIEPAPEPAQFEQILTDMRAQCEAEHAEVIALGGLHILGTERHESRRIDNQLRGRAGRQGDPGSSRFYLSLEDDLMRIFGGDRLKGLFLKLGMEEDVPIEAGIVSRSIERAQKQVEGQHFTTRKHLLEYDDVMNKQRTEVYRWRLEILQGKGSRDYVLQKTEEIVDWLLETHAGEKEDPSEWRTDELKNAYLHHFGLKLSGGDVDFAKINFPELREVLLRLATARYEAKEKAIGPDMMRRHEQVIMLNIVDSQWKDHLYAMDHLKEGIGLRGYGQRDPLTEYKRESFDMFSAMKERIENEIVRFLFHLEPVNEEEQRQEQERRARARERALVFSAPPKEAPAPVTKKAMDKVGRNDPCPCGSGKKFKKCHGDAEGAGAGAAPAGRAAGR